MSGPLYHFFAEDHRRLDTLLQRAITDAGEIERAVIEPKLRRHGEGLATSQALDGREQDLFLHADVLE